SFYVHQAVVLAQDTSEPIWIGRKMDAAGAKFTVFMSHDKILGYPEDYVQSTTKHEMDYVADVIRTRGWDRRRLGVEMDSYYFSARAFEQLKRDLPNAQWVDATSLVNWVRIVKSPREIEYMRQAGKIVERTMKVAIDSVRPGMRQCDAVAEVYKAQISGTRQYGGDYTSSVPTLPTGARASAPHLTWTEEKYKRGESINIELGGCRYRYHSALARAVSLGKPSEQLVRLAAVTNEGLEAALDTVKPGLTCHDVDAAFRRVIERAGYSKESRSGYSIGLNYPPDWGEHTASLRPGDRTVLEPNMCFHMIVGMWMEDWGYVASETFRVTEGGHETFASLPRKLYVKDGAASAGSRAAGARRTGSRPARSAPARGAKAGGAGARPARARPSRRS
ncbi:MAG: M24 family metallopeptidase, partial [Alphaproteobacteria bacterium]